MDHAHFRIARRAVPGSGSGMVALRLVRVTSMSSSRLGPVGVKTGAKSRNSGFTLMELIVTMALAAVVLTLGVPMFQDVISNNRLAATVNEFVGSLQLARSESIKRGVRVTLCKSANGTSCSSSGGYEQGWIVFADPNNNAAIDVGETIIRVFEAFPTGANMTLTGNTHVARYVSYVATGATQLIGGGFQAGTLTLCAAPKARRIVINSVGRVRTIGATCS